MKKLMSLITVLMLSGCAGESLFDGPSCNTKPAPVPQPQPCIQPMPCAQPRPCAQPQPQPCVQKVVQKKGQLAGVIYFGIGSDHLNDADKAELSRIAQYAKEHNVPVNVYGHASHKVSKGAEAKKDSINQDISIKRTQNVANTLATMGVNPNMITAMAYSDSRPAEVEVDAKTEALNRRVEIYLDY